MGSFLRWLKSLFFVMEEVETLEEPKAETSEAPQPQPLVSSTPPSDSEADVRFQLVERVVWTPKLQNWFAMAFVVLALWFIFTATFTDASRRWVPYTPELAQLLVPEVGEGEEPIELLELTHTLTETSMQIEGKLKNVTDSPLNLRAVVSIGLRTTVVPVVRTVAVAPNPVEAGHEALFRLEEVVQDQPTGYSVKFELANGALLRHKDARGQPTY
ncbi:MAG: hypothetical protein AB1898_07060 [Acidobacteriota bacterium]